jgi:hypothetical protein
VSAYAGDGRARVLDKGVCPVCKFARGSRTVESLRVESFPARGNVLRLDCDGVAREAYSSELIAALSVAEREPFEWREVFSYRKSRRRFFELVPRQVLSFVALIGPSAWTWRCSECNGTASMFWTPGCLELPDFIEATNSLASAASFAVGDQREPQLCLSSDRWRVLAGQPYGRGILNTRVGVLDAPEVGEPEVLPMPLFDELSELKSRLWDRWSGELLATDPEITKLKANPNRAGEMWKLVHERLDERLALPNLLRERLCKSVSA